MKTQIGLFILLGLVLISFTTVSVDHPNMTSSDFVGAWENKSEDGTVGLWIITEKHFSVTFYKSTEFQYTEGGEWNVPAKGKMQFVWEYHTRKSDLIGKNKVHEVSIENNKMIMAGTEWTRVDSGDPGKLAGAWLITGRYRNGEMSERTPGARRTMKILSGTKFQWIAYNVETKEFFGTGGGSYTTEGGKYTEQIEFFSRDNSRVGASLQFDFKIEDGKWRHSGESSKGDPLDEVWIERGVLGI